MTQTPSRTFDPEKPVRTRGGCPARVLASDLNHRSGDIIAAALEQKDGSEIVTTFRADGRFIAGQENEWDLINVPAKHRRWIGLYRRQDGGVLNYSFTTREDALAFASPGPDFALLALREIEIEEGEGLEPEPRS